MDLFPICYYIAFNSSQEMGSKRFVGFLDHFTALAL